MLSKLKKQSLLLTTFLIFSAHFSFGQLRTPDQEPFIPGELIVQIDPQVDLRKLLSNLPAHLNFEVIAELSPIMRAWHVRFNPSTVNQMEAVRMVNQLPGITLVQNNHVIELRETVPNDTEFTQQWHHRNTGQGGGTVDADIDSDEAWDITTGGTNALGHDIVVCILEQVNFSHNDLTNNRWVNPHEIPGNGIDDDGNGYIDDLFGWDLQSNSGSLPTNNSGHGTNVAGMIGAQGNNNLGVVGANWNVKMMNVTGYNINSEASVVAAYNYPLTLRKRYNETQGAQGAFVVATNASWGIDGANPNNYPIWCNFYDTLGKYGILNCGATTNSNLNVDVSGDMPTACSSTFMVGVGRSDRNDNFAGGYGLTTIDLAAPGINVRTTANGNTYTTTTGTSFASPLTAGVIALMYSIPCPTFMGLVMNDPKLGAEMVFEALMQGTDPKASLTNFFISGGRLNAKNSIDILMDNTCSGSICFPPSNINAAATGDNTASISWNNFSGSESVNVYYRPVGSNDWALLNSTGTSIDLQGLNECAMYEVYLETVCEDELISSTSAIISFSTLGCGNCIELPYCEANATNGDVIFNIQTPSPVTGNYPIISATQGWGMNLNNNSVVGDLVIARDSLACGTLTNAAEVNGKIAVVYRGTCEFGTKALRAQQAGAIGVIIINNASNPPANLGPGADGAGVTIPVIMISQADGTTIRTAMNNGLTRAFMGVKNEAIGSVQIGNFTHTSGNDNGYGNHLYEGPISLEQGGSYSFAINPDFGGALWNESYRMWIDFNQNGTFEAGEMVYGSPSPTSTSVSGNFTVPANAETGSTRLRIIMNFGASVPNVCGSFVGGEVEDYCVQIVEPGSTAILSENYADFIQVFPNPTSGELTFKSSHVNMKAVELLTLTGQLIEQLPIENGVCHTDVSKLSDGIYLYRILSEDNTILVTNKFVVHH